jgi:drug/metabolite transporter (DMT)-like permease
MDLFTGATDTSGVSPALSVAAPASPTRARVYGMLAVGILSIAMSGIFTRWAHVPGPVSAFYRVAIAEIVLAPVFLRSVSRGSATYDRRAWLLALAAGVFFVLDLGMWNTSLLLTSVANSTLLANDAPIIVGLIALVVFHERLRFSYWLGMAIAVAGMAVIVGPDVFGAQHADVGIGDALALAAGISYAMYLTVTQRVRARMDTLASLWIPGFTGTILLLIFCLVTHQTLWGFSSGAWLSLVGLGLISQALGWMSINYALGHLPASVVSVTLLGQPVLTAILAVPLLSQPIGSMQMLGGAMALTGIYLVNRGNRGVKE